MDVGCDISSTVSRAISTMMVLASLPRGRDRRLSSSNTAAVLPLGLQVGILCQHDNDTSYVRPSLICKYVKYRVLLRYSFARLTEDELLLDPLAPP